MADSVAGQSAQFGFAQSQGSRPYQEDEIGFQDPSADSALPNLVVLADGMGGHAGGKEASHLAVRTFLDNFADYRGDTPTRLKTALDAANNALAGACRNNPNLQGMGCTIVGLVVHEDSIEWISVGDSPLYLLDNDGLVRLNADHSMLPVLRQLVEKGDLTDEEFRTDRRRNALRSAVTGNEINLVDLTEEPHCFRSGQALVLASDGLDSLPGTRIMEIVKEESSSATEAAQSLVHAVDDLDRPGQDNTTVAVLFHSAPRPTTSLADANTLSGDRRLPPPPDKVRRLRTRRCPVKVSLVLTLGIALSLALLLLVTDYKNLLNLWHPGAPDTSTQQGVIPETAADKGPLQIAPESTSGGGSETGGSGEPGALEDGEGSEAGQSQNDARIEQDEQIPNPSQQEEQGQAPTSTAIPETMLPIDDTSDAPFVLEQPSNGYLNDANDR